MVTCKIWSIMHTWFLNVTAERVKCSFFSVSTELLALADLETKREPFRMWMSKFSRVALPALQRSTSAMARPALRACSRPGLQTAGQVSSRLTSVQLRGQQTLGSASLPLARHSVRHARALDEERMMEVEWEDGGQSLYPFTWLRDNCQCPLCTLESAQARKLLMADLDIHTGVDTVEVINDNKVSCSEVHKLCINYLY